MKIVWCVRLVLLLFIFIIGSLCPASTVAYWNFEDGSNGTALSDMANAGSVDLENGYIMYGYSDYYGPSFSSFTSDGTGLSCFCDSNHQDGYTIDPAINAWSPTEWTIELTVCLNEVSGWETIIGRDGSTNGDRGSDFYLQNNGNDNKFRVNFETVSGMRWFLDGDVVGLPGRWYDIAVTCDGATVIMYLDDGTGYTQVGSLDISSLTAAENALATSGANWTFGRGWYNGDFVDHIDGYIDNVRFSDEVLPVTEFLGYDFVTISETENLTILYSGNDTFTDSYTIVLNRQPSDDVTITVTPPVGIGLGNGSGGSINLVFTDEDWDQPQTITVQIADTSVVLSDSELISHSASSSDSNFDGVNIPDVKVNVEDDSCGIWGYLPSDLNYDCMVDLFDFAQFSNLWLTTEVPADLDEMAQEWLVDTLVYEPDVYNASIQETDEPFFINTANIINTIDEKVYGHFLEHIYHSANGGLWGDLVWNRSFENGADGGGIWSIDSDELIQSSSSATDVHIEFGDDTWTDYELTLQAQKDSGSEGFLIVVRASDSSNFYWVNIGGWANTLNCIESEVLGSRSTVSDQVSGSVTTGQWYDITVRCESNNIKVWMDEADDAGQDDLILDYTDESSTYLAGAVGVGTWSTAARFRNIVVKDISDDSILYSGLPTLKGNPFGADFWSVYGSGTASVTTDSYNDDYAVEFTSDGTQTGLQQDNFAFIPQAYQGSLWMKGSLASGVRVQLMDGNTVLGYADLSAPATSWAEYSFSITPSASTDDGSLRIRPLGSGTVTIDQVSMMGQDSINTGGYRPDLLAAVDELRPPIIRWPGGCFASLYLWKDGIGPQETRRKYSAYMWEDQDTNSYGTDEFLKMCEMLDSEPLLCINTGVMDSACGSPAQWKLDSDDDYLQYTLDWMEYCNGAPNTTWGAVRAANGHKEPYNVTYWEIDNETWDAGSSAYIAKVLEFAPAMRDKANELGVPIVIIAVGGNGTDMSWNQAIIDSCAEEIDFISIHNYDDPSEYKSGPNAYDALLTSLENYIAASANPEMKIYNSEWNAQSIDWRTGLYAGGILNVYEKHGENFKIGGPALFLRHISAGSWNNAFINFDHTGWFPAPNYVVMRLWHDHYSPNVVETTGDDTDLNVVSTMSDDETTLNIQIVNPDSADKSLEFEIDSSFVPETAVMHYVAPGDLYAANTMEYPDAVSVEAKVIGVDGQKIRFAMPAYSVAVVTVKTSDPHKTAFLYSSFRDNGEDGLHLAYSYDGYTFTALKGDSSYLTPAIGSSLMRDPSICQGPDGTFHLVWTTGWYDDGIGIAHSDDLITWTTQTYLDVMSDQPYVYNCWAPEIFYDDATGKYLIFWSSTLTEGSTNDHRIYYISTEDFVTYTDTALFYDPDFSCIDAFIAKDDNKYVMVLKDERSTGKNVRIAFADNAEGPYNVPPSVSITPGSLWVEGPSIVKIGPEWMLYYDAYTSGYMGGQTSTDLSTWTDVTSSITFPGGTRHGTVFKVTRDVVDNLIASESE